MTTAYPDIAAAQLTRAGAVDVGSNRPLVIWLALCCALVFTMVVVGGITRLTHSGLSITEWQPIVGTLPPLNAADWDDAFAKYRATPEFRDVNHAMTLAEFKGIFWWEYFHRLLGRAIGFVFLIPYVVFAVRRRIPPGYAWPLAGIFALGGLQGVIGWLMVASGLVDDPRVSQFRLTAHLSLAFLIFGAMLWTALSLAYQSSPTARSLARRGPFGLAVAVAIIVFVMVMSGGFVAGIRAGLAYNTFPLMNGRIVPAEILMLDPVWKNFFWNMATVQFDHRLIGWLLAVLVPVLAWRVRRDGASRRAVRASTALLAMVIVQLSLGIATLVNGVPLPLAALHQAGAVVVFGLILAVVHALRQPDARIEHLPNGSRRAMMGNSFSR
ncbi:MAG TPA: COX15/CtaA family protein [Casimicrobiaceae bacterium]|jgi:cytochrome c oxidase assembly protein subunit 15|nr:COX15/CtaA family protein [Casimicrobiaceae bacterium]